jgi:hypothetical protein
MNATSGSPAWSSRPRHGQDLPFVKEDDPPASARWNVVRHDDERRAGLLLKPTSS